jgi:hypothetical protein
VAQAGSRAPAALQVPEGTSLAALLPHGHHQLASQNQEPAATCASGPQAPCFATLLVPGDLLPNSIQRPSAPLGTAMGEHPLPDQRAGTLAPSMSANLPLCGHQEICFPKVHRGPALPASPEQGIGPVPPLRVETTAPPLSDNLLLCGQTKRPVSPQCTGLNDPHHVLLPMGESQLLSQRSGTLAPSLKGGRW